VRGDCETVLAGYQIGSICGVPTESLSSRLGRARSESLPRYGRGANSCYGRAAKDLWKGRLTWILVTLQ